MGGWKDGETPRPDRDFALRAITTRTNLGAMHLRQLIPLFLCGVVVFGCKKKEDQGPSTDRPSATMMRDSLSRAADAIALGHIDAVTEADSMLSVVAVARTTNANVKAFAMSVMKDSHELRVAALDAANAADIKSFLPPNDITLGSMRLTLSLINSAAKTADTDAMYLSDVAVRDRAAAAEAIMRQRATKTTRLIDIFQRAASVNRDHVVAIQKLTAKP